MTASRRRPAFGDDAAVAGGLVGAAAGGPVFCGDAIADPLTGLEAALAVAESLGRGGGELIDVSMAAVAATYAALPTVASAAEHPAPPPQATAGIAGRRPSSAPTTTPCAEWSSERRLPSC